MDKLKILIIEDEVQLLDMLRRGLDSEGYDISIAMDGKTGLNMAKNHPFDLVILDLMLSGLSGIEVCKELRRSGNNIPILMLTALNSPENMVAGLDSGADDYMVKPFHFNVLNARIRTLVRRTNGMAVSHELLKVSNLEINLSSKTVKRDEKLIELTATEFRLLEFLVKNKEKVLSRVEILDHVWGVNFDMGTNVVDVYINYLRKKIDRDFEPKLIQTSFGMGYVLKEHK